MESWGLMTSRLFESGSCARCPRPREPVLCCCARIGGVTIQRGSRPMAGCHCRRVPCRVEGSFAFLGVNGNLMCVPLACMGHMRHTHGARNKGGWHPRTLAPTPQPVPSSNRLLTAPQPLLHSFSLTTSPHPHSQLHFSTPAFVQTTRDLPALFFLRLTAVLFYLLGVCRLFFSWLLCRCCGICLTKARFHSCQSCRTSIATVAAPGFQNTTLSSPLLPPPHENTIAT